MLQIDFMKKFDLILGLELIFYEREIIWDWRNMFDLVQASAIYFISLERKIMD
jgi:hypothetical protein